MKVSYSNNGRSLTLNLALLAYGGTAILIILKLIGIVNWLWLWILSPFWISLVVTIVTAIIAISLFKNRSGKML